MGHFSFSLLDPKRRRGDQDDGGGGRGSVILLRSGPGVG